MWYRRHTPRSRRGISSYLYARIYAILMLPAATATTLLRAQPLAHEALPARGRRVRQQARVEVDHQHGRVVADGGLALALEVLGLREAQQRLGGLLRGRALAARARGARPDR